jgi:hypothetical protein
MTPALFSLLDTNDAQAVNQRTVDLGAVDNRLKGVVAYALETALVGASGGRAAILGALPEQSQTEDEVSAFVETLLRCNRIRVDKKFGAMAAAPNPQAATHAVRTEVGKKVLVRLRFMCGAT